ncbi:MAG: thiol reductant ABC exporter subunit CydC, partial [Acetobacteraceae bacterium]|nr:thiol reductant ABC exporter subunit CydC [Acetobacteraceae bacterium]
MKPLLRILALWRSRAGWLLAGAALSMAAVAAGVALMVQSGRAVGIAIVAGTLAAPFLLRALGALRVILRYAERLLTHAATFRALADLRVWFFRGLAKGSAGGLGFRRAGDVLSRLVNDVEALDGLYLRILIPLAGAVLLLPALGIFIGRTFPLLAAAVVVL